MLSYLCLLCSGRDLVLYQPPICPTPSDTYLPVQQEWADFQRPNLQDLALHKGVRSAEFGSRIVNPLTASQLQIRPVFVHIGFFKAYLDNPKVSCVAPV
jgi:hypothetical protein